MGAICLSLVPILRCVSLDETHSAILLIPPGLELLFCLALVISKRNSYDSKHSLLAAEGLTYFLWTLLDFLTHIVPAARSSLQIFKILDIVLGSLTFAPLLLYTIFLFLVAQTELLQTLPIRLQAIVKYTMVVLIPMIIITNALASFLGLSYRNLSTPGRRPILAVGFLDTTAELLWTIFSDIALSLLTLYQAVSFVLFLSRAVGVLQSQRRLEASGNQVESHSLRGVFYMAAGLNLGIVETAVGFAEGGFELALARRILRFLSRAFLIIGFIKGWDTLENFHILPSGEKKRPTRRSLLNLISNPVPDTFRYVGGDPESTIQEHLRTLSVRSPATTYVGGPRVTVQFPPGRAPTLRIRLSDLVPITEDFSKPPKSAPARIIDDYVPSSPDSPSSPAPFSGLIPIKRRSLAQAAKDMMSKARSHYRSFSQNNASDTRSSILAPPNNLFTLNFEDRQSPNVAGFPSGNSSPLQSILEGSRSRMSSSSGMWLGRTVNRPSPGSRLNSDMSMVPDTGHLEPPRQSQTVTYQSGQHLTSKWTPTTEGPSSAGVSHVSPNPRVQDDNYSADSEGEEESISWIGPRSSLRNSESFVPEPRSADTERPGSWAEPETPFSQTRVHSFGEAPVRRTPEPTGSYHAHTSSVEVEHFSSEADERSIREPSDLSENRVGRAK